MPDHPLAERWLADLHRLGKSDKTISGYRRALVSSPRK